MFFRVKLECTNEICGLFFLPWKCCELYNIFTIYNTLFIIYKTQVIFISCAKDLVYWFCTTLQLIITVTMFILALLIIHLLSCWKCYLLVFSYLMLAFRQCTILYSVKLFIHKYDIRSCRLGKRSVHDLKNNNIFFYNCMNIIFKLKIHVLKYLKMTWNCRNINIMKTIK